VTADGVTLQDQAVGSVELSFAAIEKANIEYHFARPARPAHA